MQPKHLRFRYYATDAEQKRMERKAKYPHIRPDSVLVASIGTSWEPGAWQRVVDMVTYTNFHGVCCWFSEIPDTVSQLPYQNVNHMMDSACLTASNIGVEWLMLIQNDALPEPDLLMRLLEWQTPVVVPYIYDDVLGQPIAGPVYERDTGLQPVEWACFTCILIWSKVLNCFADCAPFRNSTRESWFFSRLIHYGHRAYQDTNTELKIATRPTYHGANESLGDLWEKWEEADQRRRRPPDRRPIDPNDLNQKAGIYLPPRVMEDIK